METLYIASNNETIPDFTTIIVHELRNPLTSIKLSARMMAAKVKDDDVKKYLEIISKSAQRIDDLINDLLKPSAKNRDFRETVSLHKLLDEVIHLVDDRLLLKEIEVIREYNARDVELSVIEAQLKIAFTNIIINAIDAVAPRTGKLKVVTKTTDSHYIINIEDNGCGIKPENLNDIFKPYFTDKPDGLGLGLTATQKILSANNIEIIVGSRLGVGTIFTLLYNKNRPYKVPETAHFEGLIVLQPGTFE
jgi:signal transduction histidine kinase